MSMPKWMAKYPCPGCGSGYGQCHEFSLVGIACCPDCKHPGYRTAPEPWTVEELEEMWEGREKPLYITIAIARQRGYKR